MLKRTEEIPISATNRNKLPQETGIRSLAGIKELLGMAKESRGMQVELSWTTKNPDQIFVLDVQWEAGKPDPFWCLYEENSSQSKRLWAQPFSINNIEMFYDVLVMSCGAVDHAKNLSEILKVKPNSDKEEVAKVSDHAAPPVSNETAVKIDASNDASQKVAAKVENVDSPQEPHSGMMPVYPPSPGGSMPMPVNPLGAFPMPAYNMPPHIQPIPIPIQYPSQYPPNFNQINQPVVNYPGMPGAMPPGNWTYTPNGQPVFVPGQLGSGSLDTFSLDNTLLNKQNDIGLIDLLIKAELLTESVLAAALKMRDSVLTKQLSLEAAAELLKRDHNKGNTIGDHFELAAMPSAAKPVTAEMVSEKPIKTEDKELAGSLGLLEKSGLLSADDLKTARGVSRKHGGDLVSILGAAQKLDANTLDAAKICYALEQSGLMKLEQCVIVLNYCNRSRVSFDEAMSELNWKNPRSIQK